MVFERVNIFVAISFLTRTFSHIANFFIFIEANATRSICAWSCSTSSSVSTSLRTSAPCTPRLPFCQRQNPTNIIYLTVRNLFNNRPKSISYTATYHTVKYHGKPGDNQKKLPQNFWRWSKADEL